MKLINTIIFILSFVSGLLLLISGMVPMISPLISSWAALIGLAFPVVFILTFFSFIYWAVQLKWRSLFFLACLLLNLGQMSLYAQWNKPKPSTVEAKNTLKIISFNANLFGLYQDKFASPEIPTEKTTQFDSFFKILNAQKPDIVCLQEVYSKIGGLESVTKFLQKQGHFLYAQTYTLSSHRPYGMIILSKYPIGRWQPIRFDGKTGNMAMWVELTFLSPDKKHRNAKIRLYNVHLQSFRFAQKDYDVMRKQSEQKEIDIEGSKGILTRLRLGYKERAKQVAFITESMIDCTSPKIVCGDFNDVPVSYSYRQLSSGMKDAFIESGRGIETTYKGAFPSFRIDYILFDNPIQGIQYFSFEEVPSDHKLLMATLSTQQLYKRY